MIARCEGQLARLDATVEEWRRVGRRNDTVSEADIAATESRRDKLHRLLTSEQFRELQEAVPREIAYLQADQESRLAQAIAAAAEERTTRRRTQSVAVSVLSALDRAGAPVPPALRRDLDAAAAGRSEGAAAISQGFALLSHDEGPAVTEHQRRLADALKDSDNRQSFAQWLASQPMSDQDEVLARLERRVAELAAKLGEAETAAFAERLSQAAAEPSSSRRSLLLDSLEVDLAQTLVRTRQRQALQGRLRLLAAELGAVPSDASTAMSQSILAGIEGPTVDLERLEMDSLGILDRARGEAAGRARRQAVLAGLASLGYQVTEGLETAWVRDGRIVLRKAIQPDYGVEIGGGADAARLQVRTVAIRDPAAAADAERDRDAETLWCDDLARLQAQLAASGGGIEIERALPAGATPVKVVADPAMTTDHLQRELPARPKQRARPQ
jgi:hypothetical protein